MAGVSRRYATALFELAQEKNSLQAYYIQASAVSDVMHITPEFNKMLSNPRLTLEEKETFLHRTLAGASEELIGFIYLILKNSRERELTDIFSLFLEMARARMGITSVQVFTAVPLTVLQVSVIRAKMATLLNNEIELEAVVDESLIGGLLLKAKGMVVDNTIKKYLQNLKRRIL